MFYTLYVCTLYVCTCLYIVCFIKVLVCLLLDKYMVSIYLHALTFHARLNTIQTPWQGKAHGTEKVYTLLIHPFTYELDNSLCWPREKVRFNVERNNAYQLHHSRKLTSMTALGFWIAPSWSKIIIAPQQLTIFL